MPQSSVGIGCQFLTHPISGTRPRTRTTAAAKSWNGTNIPSASDGGHARTDQPKRRRRPRRRTQTSIASTSPDARADGNGHSHYHRVAELLFQERDFANEIASQPRRRPRRRTRQEDHRQSKLNDFRRYIDTDKGWITFEGTATITRTGPRLRRRIQRAGGTTATVIPRCAYRRLSGNKNTFKKAESLSQQRDFANEVASQPRRRAQQGDHGQASTLPAARPLSRPRRRIPMAGGTTATAITTSRLGSNKYTSREAGLLFQEWDFANEAARHPTGAAKRSRTKYRVCVAGSEGWWTYGHSYYHVEVECRRRKAELLFQEGTFANEMASHLYRGDIDVAEQFSSPWPGPRQCRWPATLDGW
ncbi:hypothetical protein MAPG_10555 [Magnaporthiopsis poae ATCC 64411]|uniref:Uncharacterized protein n=1 Tax=Magnaporthiopsis poae (strain ATCC 64411 / 73-15) TaxID=644358 RepID=A0A0C4ECW6_MAGP6|nr:hypothetical protein MAPG_10555 [Magnaporthiopsis poae ATCC 64411]